MSDNRRSPRHAVDIEARMQMQTDGAQEPCKIHNLSMGGALVAARKLAMGHRVKLWFRVPTLETEIETAATVRWATDDGVGVQFDGLRARETWALGKYFESLPSS